MCHYASYFIALVLFTRLKQITPSANESYTYHVLLLLCDIRQLPHEVRTDGLPFPELSSRNYNFEWCSTVLFPERSK